LETIRVPGWLDQIEAAWAVGLLSELAVMSELVVMMAEESVDEMTYADFPNASETLRDTFARLVRNVEETVQDGALREIILSEIKQAYRRAAGRMN
jgi:hypothetical protein